MLNPNKSLSLRACFCVNNVQNVLSSFLF